MHNLTEPVTLRSGDVLRDTVITVPNNRNGINVAHGAEGWAIDNVEVRGGHYGAVLRGRGTATNLRSVNAAESGIITHEDGDDLNGVVEHLILNGFNVSGAGKSGFMALGPVRSLTLRDGHVQGCGLDGITGYDQRNGRLTVQDCSVIDVGNNGIHVAGSVVRVTGCVVDGDIKNQAAGVYVGTRPGEAWGNSAAVIDCTVMADGRYGILVARTDHAWVDSCTIDNLGTGDWHGVELAQVGTAWVVNCAAKGADLGHDLHADRSVERVIARGNLANKVNWNGADHG
jgi:hypothetical protein